MATIASAVRTLHVIDLVEVALDASAWRRVAFSLPRPWRVRVGYGRDGADRALLRAVDPGVAVAVPLPEPSDRPLPLAVAA